MSLIMAALGKKKKKAKEKLLVSSQSSSLLPEKTVSDGRISKPAKDGVTNTSAFKMCKPLVGLYLWRTGSSPRTHPELLKTIIGQMAII